MHRFKWILIHFNDIIYIFCLYFELINKALLFFNIKIIKNFVYFCCCGFGSGIIGIVFFIYDVVIIRKIDLTIRSDFIGVRCSLVVVSFLSLVKLLTNRFVL